jgi:exodeoxyribonuclease VII large subunit
MNQAVEHIYTPSELNREVRLHLEAGFPRILLEAEISNLSRPSSGHLYFSLKDEKAQIRCALFRSAAARLAIRPENGMKVLARGRIGLYEPRGEYQMIVDGLQEAGEGLLQRQFDELKNKLASEGLFDQACKQDLPAFPRRIALITSPGGAAIRDLLQVLERRWPIAGIRLYPVLVQGEAAPAEICRAIESANRHAWADLLIVGRGGGSLEDLMAFNDEAVVRAVFASAIPVVSAVGHETDFSICDFVADLRAPTPSAAAELSTPDQAILKESFSRLDRQLNRRMIDGLQRETQRLDHLSHRLVQRHPATRLAEQSRQLESSRETLRRSILRQLDQQAVTLKNLSRRLSVHQPGRKLSELASRIDIARRSVERSMSGAVSAKQQQLIDLARTLNAVSPLQTIARGYAVITSGSSGNVISSVAHTATGEDITAQLVDGRLHCTVNSSSGDKPDSEEN